MAAERDNLMAQEREAHKRDVDALKELEMEMAAKHEELENYQMTDQRREELEEELAASKKTHEKQLECRRLEKEERESELQEKLRTIEEKTKEQDQVEKAKGLTF